MRVQHPAPTLESSLVAGVGILRRRPTDAGIRGPIAQLTDRVLSTWLHADVFNFLALQAEGHQDVGMAECDSHALFRLSTRCPASNLTGSLDWQLVEQRTSP